MFTHMRVSCFVARILFFSAMQYPAQTLLQITKNGAFEDDQYSLISEDGNTIVWNGQGNLYAANAQSFTPRQLTSGLYIWTPYFSGLSGDGKVAFFIHNNQLWAVLTQGGPPMQLTRYTPPRIVFARQITVSRDGRYACYSTQDQDTLKVDIEVIDLATLKVTNITAGFTPDTVIEGAISGDGRVVAISAFRKYVSTDLLRTDRNGSSFQKLRSPSGSFCSSPRLDYLGHLIVCSVSIFDVFSVRTDVSEFTQLTNDLLPDVHPMVSANAERVSWQRHHQGTKADISMAFSEGGPIRRITYFDDLTWSRPNSMHSLNGDGTKAVISTSANVGNQNPEGERDYLLSNQGF